MADQTIAGTLSVTDKLGIGISEPIAQLHIASSTTAPSQAFLESGGALLRLSVDASSTAIGTANAFPLSIQTDGVPRLSVSSTGNLTITGALTVQNNVTIGTDASPATLEVKGNLQGRNATFTGPLTVQNNLNVAENISIGGLTIQTISSGTPPTNILQVDGRVRATAFEGNGAALDGVVKKVGDTITGPLTVQNTLTVTGNVNISAGKLQVSGGAITPATGNSETAGILFPKDPGGGSGDAAWMRYYPPRTGEGCTLEIGISNDADDHITLMPSGGVGIGTNSIDRKLVVRGGETSLEQESWQTPTFQNGWINYDVNYNSAGYFKDSLGVIHLRGLVKHGNGTIFTLPEGYRPARRELFGVATNPNVFGRIDVLLDGQVSMVTGNNGWISLDGITFKAGSRRIFFPFPFEPFPIITQ